MLENLNVKVLNVNGVLIGEFEKDKFFREDGENILFNPKDSLYFLIELFMLLKIHALRTEISFVVVPDSEFDEHKIKAGIKKMNNKNSSEHANQFALTKRETEILQLMLKGSTTKEISEQMFISANTTKTHRKKIFAKTGVKNVSGLNKIFNPLVKYDF